MDIDLGFVLTIIYLFLELLAIIAAAHAIMNCRTSHSSIAWSIFLITIPPISLPLYLLFGRSRFVGHINSRRDVDLDLHAIAEKMKKNISLLKYKHHKISYKGLENLVNNNFLSGHKCDLLIDGFQTFEAIFKAIDNAKSYIIIQTYIIRYDQLGLRLKEKLIQAQKKGISVYLLYDGVGNKLDRTFISTLEKVGVQVCTFSSKRRWIYRFQLNFRNHRKIVIVDGEIGFLGGHNWGDEYLGGHKKLTPWRDTHVQIMGPAVLDLQLTFLEDWYWANKTIPKLSWQPKEGRDHENVLIFPSGPSDFIETCSLFFVQIFQMAKTRIWIASPYFVPDQQITSTLISAAFRGVDVRIILPSKIDHYTPYFAAFNYLEEIDHPNIKVYRFLEGFMHQKVVLVDGDLSAIGTANLDNRSFRLNFEIMAIFTNGKITQKIEEMLEQDLKKSRMISIDDVRRLPLIKKFIVKLARLFAPVL